jgi:hypothetical protein
MAFKYLSWLLYPLFGCYAIYSLLYVEHKGWYSWVLSMLYGFLLTFGEWIRRSLPQLLSLVLKAAYCLNGSEEQAVVLTTKVVWWCLGTAWLHTRREGE